MKVLFYRLLIWLGLLAKDSRIWVLVYTHNGDQPKLGKDKGVEYFFTELEAVNRKEELLDKYPSIGLILYQYTGVSNIDKGPIKAIDTITVTSSDKIKPV